MGQSPIAVDPNQSRGEKKEREKNVKKNSHSLTIKKKTKTKETV